MENDVSAYHQVTIRQKVTRLEPEITETLWALPAGEDILTIENVPFAAYYYAVGDEVKVKMEEGEWIVLEIHEPSGHSVIRVIVEDASNFAEIQAQLSLKGCDAEAIEEELLLAVDIPKEVEYPDIITWLEAKAEAGVLDFEEACVSGHHQGEGE